MIQQFLRHDFMCSKQLRIKKQETKATKELKQSPCKCKNTHIFNIEPQGPFFFSLLRAYSFSF